MKILPPLQTYPIFSQVPRKCVPLKCNRHLGFIFHYFVSPLPRNYKRRGCRVENSPLGITKNRSQYLIVGKKIETWCAFVAYHWGRSGSVVHFLYDAERCHDFCHPNIGTNIYYCTQYSNKVIPSGCENGWYLTAPRKFYFYRAVNIQQKYLHYTVVKTIHPKKSRASNYSSRKGCLAAGTVSLSYKEVGI